MSCDAFAVDGCVVTFVEISNRPFEVMGDARFAARFVGGAHAIPDHVDDHRRAVILEHYHLEPVVERKADLSRADPIEDVAVRASRRAVRIRTARERRIVPGLPFGIDSVVPEENP